MRTPLLLIIGLLISSTALAADDQRVTYQKGMLGDMYKDSSAGTNMWKIRGVVRRNKPPSSAAKMALYRGSELALASGAKLVRIVSIKEKPLENYIGNRSYVMGYEAKLTVQATNEADPGNHCASDVKPSCATYDAMAAQTEIRPFLIILPEASK